MEKKIRMSSLGPESNITDLRIFIILFWGFHPLQCDKNAFLILMFFSSNFRTFHVCSFNNSFNIFKNALYVCFFGTMGSFLIIPFVLAKERSFPRNDAQP